jgi:beta-carotene hydroxylase
MSTAEYTKPELDESFFEPGLFTSLVYIGYGLGMFAGFGWLNYEVAVSDWHLALKILCMIPCAILSSAGLYTLAFAGHEGMHGSLLPDAKWGLAVGMFFSSAVMTYFDLGLCVRHWDHHKYTNTDKDPDLKPTAHLKTWWSRFLLSRIIFNWLYARNVFNMAMGRLESVAHHYTPYSPQQLIRLARLNILYSLVWLSIYAAITILNWKAGVFGILLPSSVLFFMSSWQSYIDHAGLGDEPYKNAYSRPSLLMSLFFFGSNYHLEHHMYPKVPACRLHKVHRILLESDMKDAIKPAVINGFFEAYRTLSFKNPNASQ